MLTITIEDILNVMAEVPSMPPPNLWFISHEDADEILKEAGIERIPGINVYHLWGQDICISKLLKKGEVFEIPHEQRIDIPKLISI